MVSVKTIALGQLLILTKFKICTVLPRNIMAGYEEDNLHCHRLITFKFCLTSVKIIEAAGRCGTFLLEEDNLSRYLCIRLNYFVKLPVSLHLYQQGA